MGKRRKHRNKPGQVYYPLEDNFSAAEIDGVTPLGWVNHVSRSFSMSSVPLTQSSETEQVTIEVAVLEGSCNIDKDKLMAKSGFFQAMLSNAFQVKHVPWPFLLVSANRMRRRAALESLSFMMTILQPLPRYYSISSDSPRPTDRRSSHNGMTCGRTFPLVNCLHRSSNGFNRWFWYRTNTWLLVFEVWPSSSSK